ncbi:GspH/FimT family pseudopilin [Candidatus Methylobacter oryzae]|uniref:Type II secretion system protein H n=1 Tax=Candidatus Methylobacter oryzae TaxID=2497749 RepID=A0ABY3CI99_9GAMM|nr:GspH/FimT family pseudopilin [Candidatus Methylobacter oryzae]TRX02945.1 prepilin-type N-terminal cleavage/methylation domain-containing protein [Candidatus Methylobacter oryzae]
MNRQKNAGFTVLEIMIVVAIACILAAVAVPSFQDMIERDRLKQVVESLKSDLQFARTEAIKRNQDIHFSRSSGNAGAWCYGLNPDANCNCATPGSCAVKTISGSDFGTIVNMDAAATNNSTFDFRRGTIGANRVTFSTDSYVARVFFSDIGRVRTCTPPVSGKTGLPGYPPC